MNLWYLIQLSKLHIQSVYLVGISFCHDSFIHIWYKTYLKRCYIVRQLYSCCRINFKHQIRRYLAFLVYVYKTRLNRILHKKYVLLHVAVVQISRWTICILWIFNTSKSLIFFALFLYEHCHVANCVSF